MEQTKRKMSKVGTVWEKKDGSGFYVTLGTENKKRPNPRYDLHTEIIVRDGDGNVVARQTDGFLTLIDPRQNEKANLEGLAKVPQLRFEILVSNND